MAAVITKYLRMLVGARYKSLSTVCFTLLLSWVVEYGSFDVVKLIWRGFVLFPQYLSVLF